jgi:hypothetical protein
MTAHLAQGDGFPWFRPIVRSVPCFGSPQCITIDGRSSLGLQWRHPLEPDPTIAVSEKQFLGEAAAGGERYEQRR